jgi:hypothetical protein
LSVPKKVLKTLWSLKGALVPYPSSGFDGFGHLSGLGELNGLFFNPYIIINKWWAYHIV